MKWNFRPLVKGFIGLTLLFSLTFSAQAAQKNTSFASRPDVQKFIAMMVTNYGFQKPELEKVFAQVQPQPNIVLGMSATKEQIPWYKYRQIFITPARVDQGVAFWKKHQKALNAIAARDGVDPSVIVAILGVETYYGKNQGSYRVIDSLSTLAFDYPPREKFFREELKEYLLLTRENKIDPLKLKGSYAGAMGLPQFMPSSYRQYAVTFGSDRPKDLSTNPDDVIASVSNYFKQHGWQSNQAVALPAQVKGNAYKIAPTNQLKPTMSAVKLEQYGISANNTLAPNTKVSFLALAMPNNAQQYWLGLNNFYVISRYNPRLNYAMAVFQLSQAIKQAYQKA